MACTKKWEFPKIGEPQYRLQNTIIHIMLLGAALPYLVYFSDGLQPFQRHGMASSVQRRPATSKGAQIPFTPGFRSCLKLTSKGLM